MIFRTIATFVLHTFYELLKRYLPHNSHFLRCFTEPHWLLAMLKIAAILLQPHTWNNIRLFSLNLQLEYSTHYARATCKPRTPRSAVRHHSADWLGCSPGTCPDWRGVQLLKEAPCEWVWLCDITPYLFYKVLYFLISHWFSCEVCDSFSQFCVTKGPAGMRIIKFSGN